MTTTEEICAHKIEFWYDTKSPLAVPDDSEIEHVKELLIENYKAGELNMTTRGNNGHEYHFRGWWKIVSN